MRDGRVENQRAYSGVCSGEGSRGSPQQSLDLSHGLERGWHSTPGVRVAGEAEQAESSHPTAGISEDLENVVWT